LANAHVLTQAAQEFAAGCHQA